ncbi:MAG: hypothetical protein K6U04_06670 [Armatimonadetes bacterium]|nr:hypothetical protein [Armatimonadota bacterium]
MVLKNSPATAVKAAAGQFARETLQIDFRSAGKALEKALGENLELRKNLNSAFSGGLEYTVTSHDGLVKKNRE